VTPETTSLRDRIRSEFLEMPDLQLTPAQASRLWVIDARTSQRLLDELRSSGFLARTRRGAYLRAS
jgi:hypothetical protein